MIESADLRTFCCQYFEKQIFPLEKSPRQKHVFSEQLQECLFLPYNSQHLSPYEHHTHTSPGQMEKHSYYTVDFIIECAVRTTTSTKPPFPRPSSSLAWPSTSLHLGDGVYAPLASYKPLSNKIYSIVFLIFLTFTHFSTNSFPMKSQLHNQLPRNRTPQ